MATPVINTIRKAGFTPAAQAVISTAKSASIAAFSTAPAPVKVNSTPVNPGALSYASTIRYGLIGPAATIKNYGGL
jgi:hypothetical protein